MKKIPSTMDVMTVWNIDLKDFFLNKNLRSVWLGKQNILLLQNR